jgi:hypothetical protein
VFLRSLRGELTSQKPPQTGARDNGKPRQPITPLTIHLENEAL